MNDGNSLPFGRIYDGFELIAIEVAIVTGNEGGKWNVGFAGYFLYFLVASGLRTGEESFLWRRSVFGYCLGDEASDTSVAGLF